MQFPIAQIYGDEKMERPYRGSLRVLEETGFFIDHDGLLDRFEKRKMRVDRAKRRVFITEELVNDLLRPDPDRYRGTQFPGSFPFGFGVRGSYPRSYDWPTRATRRADTALLEEVVRVFGSIPELSHAGRVFTLSEVPPAIEPIVAT